MSSTQIEVETLVIGAGVIGSSLAMHLSRLGMPGVRVIDFDLEGSFSSSELNAGGVRASWILPLNIQMSKHTIDYFAEHADEVGYRACGYLWLHTEKSLQRALSAADRQRELGWPVESWDVAALRRRTPFIDKTDDLAGAVFAPRDGLVNPNLLKQHFRTNARSAGVVFDDRTLCLGSETVSHRGETRIRVTALTWDKPLSLDERREILSTPFSQLANHAGARKVEYLASHVVNCAGAWAAQVAKTLGYESPAKPVRRQICIFDCRDVDLTPYGMIVDTSGVYFHPEATNGLSGYAVPGETPGVNFEYDGESFFNDVIWPALYERSSSFERLKHLTGWAGLYEISPDESAILGETQAGRLPGGRVFEAHSFSGHGVMHCHTAGLCLAEKIIRGRFETMDLSPLSASRFGRGEHLRESMFI